MSIPVELDALEAKTAEYGVAYLLTVTDDERTKIVAVHPAWEGSQLVVATGGGTARNASARSQVTLAYPPAEPDGYTLIVDGLARVIEQPDGASLVTIAPSGAVLHRAAPAGFVNTATGCTHDCAPVD
ncbi:MAG: pyridoxamine 5'-phosphate oxidase family protein [Actinomycetota bacterium]